MQLAAGKIRKRTAEEEAEEEALSKMTVSERLAHIKGECGSWPVANVEACVEFWKIEHVEYINHEHMNFILNRCNSMDAYIVIPLVEHSKYTGV